MEQASCGEEEYTSGKGKNGRKFFRSQPEKTKEYRRQADREHIADQDPDHGNLREQTSDQDIRSQKTIVRELITVYSAAQAEPVRQKSMLFQTGVPDRLCKCGVLAQPVHMGTEDAVLGYHEYSERCKDQDQRSQIKTVADHWRMFHSYNLLFSLGNLRRDPAEKNSAGILMITERESEEFLRRDAEREKSCIL